VELKTHRKNKFVTKTHKGPRTWADSLNKRLKLRKMNMRFRTWNVISLYRIGSLMTVAKQLSKYMLYLVTLWEVRWDRGGTGPACEYTFLYGKEDENHELGTRVLVLYIR
jgi:hypothetical protein